MKFRTCLALTMFLVFGPALAAQATYYAVHLNTGAENIITNDTTEANGGVLLFQESYNATHLYPFFGRSMVVNAQGEFFDIAVSPEATLSNVGQSIRLEILNSGPYIWSEFYVQLIDNFMNYKITNVDSSVFTTVEKGETWVHFLKPDCQQPNAVGTFELEFDQAIYGGLSLRQIAITGPSVIPWPGPWVLPGPGEAAVPVPGTIWLLGTGLMGILGARRLRR